MVTKLFPMLDNPCLGFVLAKKLMVTKQDELDMYTDMSFVLAKKLMVTKLMMNTL